MYTRTSSHSRHLLLLFFFNQLPASITTFFRRLSWNFLDDQHRFLRQTDIHCFLLLLLSTKRTTTARLTRCSASRRSQHWLSSWRSARPKFVSRACHNPDERLVDVATSSARRDDGHCHRQSPSRCRSHCLRHVPHHSLRMPTMGRKLSRA